MTLKKDRYDKTLFNPIISKKKISRGKDVKPFASEVV
jgi:hypothetical protein